MRNRTFNIPSGAVYVDPDGARYADLLLYAFDQTEQKMEVRWNTKTSLTSNVKTDMKNVF